MKKTKIVIFSEFYAPINAVQTFRNLKISKYLAIHGFKQYIFTAESYKNYNEHLLNDIPNDAEIYRKKLYFSKGIENFQSLNLKKNLFSSFLQLIKDIIFPIDKNFWWVISFLPTIIKIIKKEHIEYVMIGGYPYSAFWGGYLLKLICKVKLILDFHDPWKSHPQNIKQSILRRICFSFCEKLCVKKSDLISVCTDSVKYELIKNYSKNINVILVPNGFDLDEYKVTSINKKKFIFFYAGQISFLSDEYNPENLIRTFLCFIEKYKIVDCELHLAGATDEYTLKKIKNLNKNIIIYEKQPRFKVLELFNYTDCFIHFHYPNSISNRLSLKICEYAVCHKPIISFNIKEGDLYNFISEHRLGITVDTHDIDEMIEAFHKAYNKEIKICENPSEELKDFNWSKITEVLAENIKTLK